MQLLILFLYSEIQKSFFFENLKKRLRKSGKRFAQKRDKMQQLPLPISNWTIEECLNFFTSSDVYQRKAVQNLKLHLVKRAVRDRICSLMEVPDKNTEQDDVINDVIFTLVQIAAQFQPKVLQCWCADFQVFRTKLKLLRDELMSNVTPLKDEILSAEVENRYIVVLK